MENKQMNSNEGYNIDLMQILKALWNKIWVLILVCVVFASAGYCVSRFFIQPDYSASVLLYVNNGSINLGNGVDITQSDLTASQQLVKTYTEILKNRTTLERVAERAQLNYTYKQLSNMIKAKSVNDTEVMQVTVVAKDPYEAANIANTIAEVLPGRISEIISGSTMEVVDSAIPNPEKIAPSNTKNAVMCMAVGALIVIAIIVIQTILDDTIYDEEYILQNYKYPILAKIPNLSGETSKKYGYYYYQKKSDDKK